MVDSKIVALLNILKDSLLATVARIVPDAVDDIDDGGPRRQDNMSVQCLRRRCQAAHVAGREDQVALVRWSGARRGTRYVWRRGDAADQEP